MGVTWEGQVLCSCCGSKSPRIPLERQALPSPTCQIQQVWEAAGKASNLQMNIFPKPHGYFWEWGRGARPKGRNGDLAQAFNLSLSYPRAPERGAQVEPQNLPP